MEALQLAQATDERIFPELTDAPLTPAQTAIAAAQTEKEGYIHRVLVAFDHFLNVVADGLPDETISSRAERDAQKGEFLGKILTYGLDQIQKQHGEKAQVGDTVRAETVEKIEAT